jgi:Reverse transcriptase (RNA-dependent DNA polymerase)
LTGRTTVVHVGQSSSAAAAVQFGVPQGSVLGPILYTAYVAPIGRLISSFGVQFHQCADDTQLYMKLTTPTSNGLERLRQCVDALQHWFGLNGLLLNPDKSVVVYFGTRRRLQQTNLPSHVTVAGHDVIVSDKLTVLGVTTDSELSIDQHVTSVVQNCTYHLQALSHIRSSVSRDVANTIACSVVPDPQAEP